MTINERGLFTTILDERGRMIFGKLDERGQIVFSAVSSGVIVKDSFNRANSATSLGNADTGQPWVALGGSVWGISNNEAYWVSVTDAVAVVNSGISDGIITLDCRNIKKANGIVFRAKTGTTMDGFHIQDENGTLNVYKRPAWTVVATTPAGTYSTMKVSLNGSTIKVYLDNVEKITFTDAYNLTETRHGFGTFNQLVTYDNFLVESSGAPTGTGIIGSSMFDIKNIIYSTSLFNYNSKQSLYQTLLQSFDSRIEQYQNGLLNIDSKQSIYTNSNVNFDTRNVLFNNSSGQYDAKQQIFNLTATTFNTKQTIYEIASILYNTKQTIYEIASALYNTKQSIYEIASILFNTKQNIYEITSILYDTLQQLTDGGIIGLTRFDTLLTLYANDIKLYNTKQSYYQTSVNEFNLKQSMYKVNQMNGDTRFSLYKNASSNMDLKQSIYSNDTKQFDIKQSMFINNFIDFSVRNELFKQQSNSFDAKQIISKLDTIEFLLKQTIYKSDYNNFDILQLILIDFYREIIRFPIFINRKQSFNTIINIRKQFNINIFKGGSVDMAEIKAGDNGTILEFPISGVGSLEGCNIKVTFRNRDREFEKNAIITNPIDGLCEVKLTSEDVANPGKYTFQLTVYFPNGDKFSGDIKSFPVDKNI